MGSIAFSSFLGNSESNGCQSVNRKHSVFQVLGNYESYINVIALEVNRSLVALKAMVDRNVNSYCLQDFG